MCNSNSDLDFMRDVLVRAFEERRDNLISDLFNLYEEARERAGDVEEETTPEFLTENGLGNITIQTQQGAEPITFGAAAPVDMTNFSLGEDVISFS